MLRLSSDYRLYARGRVIELTLKALQSGEMEFRPPTIHYNL